MSARRSMHLPTGMMMPIFSPSNWSVVKVVVAVVEIITTTTEKSQYWQGFWEFSGRSGRILIF